MMIRHGYNARDNNNSDCRYQTYYAIKLGTLYLFTKI
jgi:hypothetical protein